MVRKYDFKRKYDFELHHYAPELNKAFIHGMRVPGYVPNISDTYDDCVQDLRAFLRRGKSGSYLLFSVDVKSSLNLPETAYTYTARKDTRKFFLKHVTARHSGTGDFLQDDGSYLTKDFNFKFKNLRNIR